MTDQPLILRRRWQADVTRLSGLQVKVLVAAVVIALIGTGGVVWSWLNRPPAATKVTTVSSADKPTNGRSMFGDQPVETTTVTTVEPPQTWGEWASGKGVRLGVGFLGGFVVGFATRAYVKTVAVVAGVITVLLGVASYFELFNIDFSAVKTHWASSSSWLLTQADKFKDVVLAHLPSSTAGVAGVFFGMLRR